MCLRTKKREKAAASVILRIIIFGFILLFFISFSQSVLASEYDYTLQKELNVNVKTGDVDVGRLIFTPRIINESTHHINVNDTTKTLQVKDSLCNNLSENINIANHSLLLAGQCLTDLSIGSYFADSTTTNFSVVLLVAPPTVKTIVLSAEYSPFPLVFSENNFSSNESTDIFVNASLPFELLPGAYKLPYIINSVDHEHTINVIGFTDWNVEFEQITSKISVGDTGILGEIKINNTGNSFTKISITDDDSNGLINHPNTILSYSNVPVRFNLTYSIPSDYTLSNNSFFITFISDDGVTKQKSVSFETVDDTPPIFDGFTQSYKFEAKRAFWYNISVFDNSAVKNVSLNIANTVFFPEVIGDTYNFNIIINSTGDYDGNIFAIDESGNSDTKDVSFTINSLNSLAIEKAINMPKQRFDSWAKKIIVVSDHPTPITIMLTELSFNGSWSIKIEDEDESYIIDEVNESVSFEEVLDNVTMFFQGSKIGLYNGVFNLSTIDEHVELNPISFNGEHINYTIFESFEEANYYGAFMTVDYSDENDYEGAFTELYMKIPGWHSKDDLNTPSTKSIRDEIDRVHKQELVDKEGKLRNRILLILSLITILSFVLLKNFYDNHVSDKLIFIKSHK